jgi:serine phosphatase RsbU (regulator of sigma subunit)
MAPMEARIAVAKVAKYASAESGDSLEMIERPGGGISLVLVDGQMSGKPAKAISNVVARKAISLLAEGVRDGAAARAASDYLHTYRNGKVQATLNILSIDLQSQSLVITRNNPAPVILIRGGKVRLIDDPAIPIGARRAVRPSIIEIPLELALTAIAFTDGMIHAGERMGQSLDPTAAVERLLKEQPEDPSLWAGELLEQAVELDQGRPADDISILVAAILPHSGDETRLLKVRMPL